MTDYTKIPPSKVRQVAYEEGYQKGKADSRAEVIDKIRRYINTHRYSNDDLIEFLEQLKEQNK